MNTLPALHWIRQFHSLWQVSATCRCGFLLLPLLALVIFTSYDPIRWVALGAMLGAILHHFNFGFTRAYQQLIAERRTLGVRAILALLAISSVLFFPTLAAYEHLQGFYRPISIGLLIGSMLFGIGMALSGTCTSGMLNRLGQLNAQAPFVLLGLVIGGLTAAAYYDFWLQLPALAPVSLLSLGWAGGLSLQLGFIGVVYFYLLRLERHWHQQAAPLVGAHPWWWAVQLLSVGALLTLIYLHKPWSIATVFPYLGIQVHDLLPEALFEWAFWDYASLMSGQLERAPLDEPVFLMAAGVVLGSLLVTLLKPERAVVRPRITLPSLLRATSGGVLMGFGALISYGCNIGALFSGTASGSLHGWLWLLGSLGGFMLASRSFAWTAGTR